MNKIQKLWHKLFPKPAQPLPAGTYSYQAPPDAQVPYRMFLRIEKDGQGIMILNASTVLHLNQTATELIYYLIQSKSEAEIAQVISERYQVPVEEALKDYQDLQERLNSLISTPDLDPVTYLEFDRMDPYSDTSAPYRLDCALTYKLGSEENYDAPEDRVKRELLTQEWCTILDKSWAAGIPHVVFTGGEPTLRNDLPELIRHAEKNGQVTGLLTDGLRLTDNNFRHALLESGLDHVMIVLDVDRGQSWESVRDVLAEDIALTVHITISPENKDKILESLDTLSQMGIQKISLSISDQMLEENLKKAREKVADLNMTLIWDLPVPYSAFNPVSLELRESLKLVDGSGKAWLYVEPDGDVLPAQGINKVIGNLLAESWENIWEKSQ